jgi:hypothetical protein
MEERLDYSVKTGRQSTKRELTAGDALEILQSAVLMARKCGITVKVSPLYRAGNESVILVLEGVKLDDGSLVQVTEQSAINGNVPPEIQDESSGGRPPRKVREARE